MITLDTKKYLRRLPIPSRNIAELIRTSDTWSAMQKYQLLENLRRIVEEIRRDVISFHPDELVPKMLAVGRTRGTNEFEKAVTDLLAILARKIPSSEYSEEFEHFI